MTWNSGLATLGSCASGLWLSPKPVPLALVLCWSKVGNLGPILIELVWDGPGPPASARLPMAQKLVLANMRASAVGCDLRAGVFPRDVWLEKQLNVLCNQLKQIFRWLKPFPAPHSR